MSIEETLQLVRQIVRDYPVVVTSLSAVCLSVWLVLLSRPAVRRDARTGKALDPVGSFRLKNFIAYLMARISRMKETRKQASETLREQESFHKPEPHPFFNESYYYNGADEKNDRLISRISRRGEGGNKSLVFLMFDLAKHGIFSLEQDNVPVDHSVDKPSACGLVYTCEVPMKRWKIEYEGPMQRGCHHPSIPRESLEQEHVKISLTYTTQTPLFWYMKDDCSTTLAKNLSQEPWGVNFAKVCLKRSNNHGHYEDFGRCKGEITVGDNAPEQVDFGMFRDHSWDIRVWSSMDNLLILLLGFHEPLVVNGRLYEYFDLTLVGMPGNTSGVARYTTGYFMGTTHDEILTVRCATSINDISFKYREDGTREPLDETAVTMVVGKDGEPEETELYVEMGGKVKRMEYWPDNGAFEVFEDAMETCTITNKKTGQVVTCYGTRQSGFRVGDYDPSQGGCG